jgi:hypothetical protein
MWQVGSYLARYSDESGYRIKMERSRSMYVHPKYNRCLSHHPQTPVSKILRQKHFYFVLRHLHPGVLSGRHVE